MSAKLTGYINQTEKELVEAYQYIDEISFQNHQKVLKAFQDHKVSEYHFNGSTGYGYGDIGRETLERVWAQVFGTEDALVRPQFASGTHTITVALFALCRPGDHLVALGSPYDTLLPVIGKRSIMPGSLADFGIKYREVPLSGDGKFNKIDLLAALDEKAKVFLIQRSGGYQWRQALSVSQIQDIVKLIKISFPHIKVIVDNCYGEFSEIEEPGTTGADLVCGSLIKNPGGGLVPTGGYIAGTSECVSLAADRLTAPGLNGEVGASLTSLRLMFQGLYLAPHFVAEALKGAVLAAKVFSEMGYKVMPDYKTARSDIIQAIRLDKPELLLAFCKGVQMAAPIDAHAIPEPVPLPGYDDGVVMAAGTFIQGGSLEMTADAPMRKPYAVFLQGGLSLAYIKLGIISVLEQLESIDSHSKKRGVI